MTRQKERSEDSTDSAPGDLPVLLAFLNTLDYENDIDTLTSPEALGDWLHEHGLLPETVRPDQADLQRTLAARLGLRALLGATAGAKIDEQALAILDLVAASSPCHVRFGGDGAARFDSRPNGVDGVLGRFFGIILVAQVLELWPRLKLCANKSCRRAFYDASNNRRGKWCSMRRCGNKAKALTYRRRSRRRFGQKPIGGRIPH